MISNCGHDERGKYSGGKAGDQTGTEWQVINWYNRPWKCVLRHPDAATRKLIAQMAKAAAAGGCDALSLINTITGMKIDIHRRKFVLANKTGGMSGPAIKPVAVRMVYQVSHACKLPIIGMGGILTGEDAIEMMMAGATMVSVGTANFHNPRATMEVLDGMKAYMERYHIEDINEIIGCID